MPVSVFSMFGRSIKLQLVVFLWFPFPIQISGFLADFKINYAKSYFLLKNQ